MSTDLLRRSRWKPLSIASFLREALAYPLGVVFGVSAVLMTGPEPELFGRLGIGVFAILFLAPSALLFVAGFLLANRICPTVAGWTRSLQSFLAGFLFGLGWLGIEHLGRRLHAIFQTPSLNTILMWVYYIAGPVLLPVGIAFLSRIIDKRSMKTQHQSGAA
jgi:cytochrome c biogenesis protein CcdA